MREVLQHDLNASLRDVVVLSAVTLSIPQHFNPQQASLDE
jgi:hypothetical protein